jgi:hypothetical protein
MAYINNSLNNSAYEDFLVTTATAGTDRALTVSNTDNSAAASAAHVQVTVGGSTSTGDPYVNFLVAGAGTFSIGIDNSNSDKLVISNSAALGTTDVTTFSSSVVAIQSGVECIVGGASMGNTQGHLVSYYNNAAKWASGDWLAPHIEAFDEAQGLASASIYLTSRTANGGICRFGLIDVPGNNQDGTLYLAHNDTNSNTDGILTSKASISWTGRADLPAGLHVGTGADETAAIISAQQSQVGSFFYQSIFNTDNTNAGSSSGLSISSGGAGGGDAFITYGISGVKGWSNGIDNSDSDKYKICSSVLLGGTDVLVITGAGEVTMPLQPAFLARQNSTASNVTGDAKVYTLGSSVNFTEIFDQNSDFNVNGTFTAPVTGRYTLGFSATLTDLAAAMNYSEATIVTSNRSYFHYLSNPGVVKNSANNLTVSVSSLVDMDAGDTATFYVKISGGTKVVDVYGDANMNTFVYGNLEC